MSKKLNIVENSIQTYYKRATSYNFIVSLFNLLSPFGFNIGDWRKQAVQKLNLKRGDVVVDIGCGTGLNFPLIENIIGTEGKIIGVDLSQAMLNQAQEIIKQNGWKNIKLIRVDAAKFNFPKRVDGVISALTLVLVPDVDKVLKNAYKSLSSGRSLVILDMSWPKGLPLWFHHLLFFLRPYGVTNEVMQRRSWEIIAKNMKEHFQEITYRKFWMGFFYLISGKKLQ